MGKTSERTNVTVSIRDLLLYICSRWRVLLICLLAGAVLGGAFSAYRSYRSGPSSSREERSAEVYEGLSDADKATVQNNVTTLIHYLNQFEFYTSYDEKSLFQKLNPETAKVGVLTYFIGSAKDEISFESILRIYENSLLDDRFVEDVASEFGITEEEAFYYYDGIVRVGDAVEIQTQTNQLLTSVDSALIIRVYGADEDFVKKMISIVKDSVERISDSLPEGKAYLVSESVRQNEGTFIYDRQESNVTVRKQILKNCKELKEGLEGDVLDAVEYKLSEQYEGDYIDLIFPGMSEEESNSSLFRINKKWVLAGAAGLFILSVVVILIKYLLKGVIRCYDDIEYTYGIQVLGTYDDPKTASKEHKFILDRWLKHLRIKRKSQDRESSAALIAKKLQLLAKNNDVNNICVAIGPDVVTDESFMNDVAKKAEGINVTVASNILRNADAISKVLEADGVVLLEQMDRSRFSAIDEERVMCSGNNIRILGAIVAE